ncbi:MAG: hypothetical protein SGPRY_003038 [Prymnesium sp.]
MAGGASWGGGLRGGAQALGGSGEGMEAPQGLSSRLLPASASTGDMEPAMAHRSALRSVRGEHTHSPRLLAWIRHRTRSFEPSPQAAAESIGDRARLRRGGSMSALTDTAGRAVPCALSAARLTAGRSPLIALPPGSSSSSRYHHSSNGGSEVEEESSLDINLGSFFTPQVGKPATHRLIRRDRPFCQASGKFHMGRRSPRFNHLAKRDWFHVVLSIPTKLSFLLFFAVYTIAIVFFALCYRVSDYVCSEDDLMTKPFDFRKVGECSFFSYHPVVEAHVRVYAVLHEQSPEVWALHQLCFPSLTFVWPVQMHALFQTRVMRITNPNDELGGMLFLPTPQIVTHQIDRWSPLFPPCAYCQQTGPQRPLFPGKVGRDDVEHLDAALTWIEPFCAAPKMSEAAIIRCMRQERDSILRCLQQLGFMKSTGKLPSRPANTSAAELSHESTRFSLTSASQGAAETYRSTSGAPLLASVKSQPSSPHAGVLRSTEKPCAVKLDSDKASSSCEGEASSCGAGNTARRDSPSASVQRASSPPQPPKCSTSASRDARLQEMLLLREQIRAHISTSEVLRR